jgi:hypothetical protein
MMIRCYQELKGIPDFKGRYEYLKLLGSVGEITFGGNRYLNQSFYRSSEWKRVRNIVIVRDNGCDLGVDGYDIHGKIFIHHMNPLMIKDITNATEFLLDPEYLICVSHLTHNAIHYGDEDLLPSNSIVERAPNDTVPWR